MFGQAVRGSVSPIGVGVAAGAFIFGLGMQLGGGCASGTLFSVGGGSTRMLITLFFFIIGSVIGTAHMGWWTAQPAFPATSIVTTMGPWAALAASLVLFGAIAWITMAAERKRHGRLVDETKPARGPRWLTGPWPLVAGAVGLAVVNIATLTIGGRPWGVTSAFALWGAKWFAALGVDVASWSYWTAPAQAAALKSSVLMDVTSVMDFGIILGALLAAILAGKFAPVGKSPDRRSPPRSSEDCCSATARVSPMAATSARTSAASPRAACTVGYGWSPPSPATLSAPTSGRCLI